MNGLRDSVQAALAAPESARNLRGKVRAALQVLPPSMQHALACDFAEHGLTQWGPADDEKVKASVEAIQAIRRFQKGDLSVQDVDRMRRRINDLDTVVADHGRGSSRTSGAFAAIVV